MNIARLDDTGRSDGVGSDPVVGVVLAAGAGRRYGMPKILAAQGDWLNTAVSALADGGCDDVAVTMGAAVVEAPDGAATINVGNWADGLSASVRAALGWAHARENVAGVVLHVVDMPDVGAEVVARVCRQAGRRRDAVVRARYRGVPGHPVYLGADHLAGVLDSLNGDVGAAAYLRAHADIVETIDCADLASGRDIDEP
ncbi:nucleotidyltransferase family protein [Gordonia sp. 852002-50395_SCH5434458]|uniref:nucleotidyltransferase family protein n=1 Tax=Gordonia sp. 852002-50395_SCH5434458 TaxID=1834090 RepID=UPI0009ED5A05|nr:NTP transferase domain-containing protein [Gordonia sp. 852002-50395_SCH5434458]